MNTNLHFSPFFLLALGATSVACGGSSASSDSSAQVADELRVEPGHGNASIAGQDLSNGDRTNPFDTTDDPSDPEFVPQASQLRPATSDVATHTEALSTTSGTTFDLTYYVVSHRPAGDPNQTRIRDCDGNLLTWASYRWRDDAVMQGTARYNDSSGNVHTINSGAGCWVELPYAQRWGLGVENPATGNAFQLRPFRSIAVDRNTLTIGKWYWIKELAGVQMPSPASTLVHDGCVRAVDVGPAIQGRHIDWFVGYYSAYKTVIGGNSTMGGKEQISLYSGTDKCALHIQRGY